MVFAKSNMLSRIFTLCKALTLRACDETPHVTLEEIRNDIKVNLEEFDKYWVTFEQLYVFELMLIEADARRFITDAINLEKELLEIEKKEKSKGKIFFDSETYNSSWKKLVKIVGQINAVANPEGHGRDDLGVEILVKAERLIRRVSATQSKALRSLAKKVKKVFYDLWVLFWKYQQNIAIVDPQLRNNPDLVQCLVNFESVWEKAKTYFANMKWFLHFSERLEAIAEKYPTFNE